MLFLLQRPMGAFSVEVQPFPGLDEPVIHLLALSLSCLLTKGREHKSSTWALSGVSILCSGKKQPGPCSSDLGHISSVTIWALWLPDKPQSIPSLLGCFSPTQDWHVTVWVTTPGRCCRGWELVIPGSEWHYAGHLGECGEWERIKCHESLGTVTFGSSSGWASCFSHMVSAPHVWNWDDGWLAMRIKWDRVVSTLERWIPRQQAHDGK